jgi:hypothetical protein
VAEQDENRNATMTAAKNNTNNFFIPRLNWVNESVWGISEGGSVELVHQRRKRK